MAQKEGKMKNLHTAVVALLMLSGCASGYPVTFDSNPQGATLICEGTNWGYTPRTLYYSAEQTREIKQLEKVDLSACSANWISGARSNYGIFSPRQFPNGVMQTVQRPNVRGLQQDAEFALKVQTMQAAQQQAAAAQRQATAAEYQAMAAQQQATQQMLQSLKPTTCFTNYGMTTCY
jgi:hypothetical protein